MNLKPILATGLLSAVAFGALAFMPANAATQEPVLKLDATAVILAVSAAEPTQQLVWDMTYGDQ